MAWGISPGCFINQFQFRDSALAFWQFRILFFSSRFSAAALTRMTQNSGQIDSQLIRPLIFRGIFPTKEMNFNWNDLLDQSVWPGKWPSEISISALWVTQQSREHAFACCGDSLMRSTWRWHRLTQKITACKCI